MRTVAICNLKGGVAKTTTAINMAAILAAHLTQRVLVIDADSQCNTTDFLQRDKASPYSERYPALQWLRMRQICGRRYREKSIPGYRPSPC